MHDTFLFKRLAETIEELAKDHQMGKVTFLEVDVHEDSHITQQNIYAHLVDYIPTLVDHSTLFQINKGKAPMYEAIIQSLEGIKNESIRDSI